MISLVQDCVRGISACYYIGDYLEIVSQTPLALLRYHLVNSDVAATEQQWWLGFDSKWLESAVAAKSSADHFTLDIASSTILRTVDFCYRSHQFAITHQYPVPGGPMSSWYYFPENQNRRQIQEE